MDNRKYPALRKLFGEVVRQGHQTAKQQAEGRKLSLAVDWATDGCTVWLWDDVMAARRIPVRVEREANRAIRRH